MARFRSSAASTPPQIANWEPVTAELYSCKRVESQYDPRGQIECEWILADGASTPVRDWLNFSTGAMPGGQVAMLRQLIAALTGRPQTDEPWVDDETFEYGYGDPTSSPPAGRIAAGIRVNVRGSMRPSKKDPTVFNYRIEVFEPAGSPRTPAPAQPAASPAQLPLGAPAAPQASTVPMPAPQALQTRAAVDDADLGPDF